MTHDAVNHPSHYTSHPSGVECLEVTRLLPFDVGNGVKYVWRTDLKNGLEDLRKSAFYLEDHLEEFGRTIGWTREDHVYRCRVLLGRVIDAEEDLYGHGHPRPTFFHNIAQGHVDRAWASVLDMIKEAQP